jgi:hypothetical protein
MFLLRLLLRLFIAGFWRFPVDCLINFRASHGLTFVKCNIFLTKIGVTPNLTPDDRTQKNVIMFLL